MLFKADNVGKVPTIYSAGTDIRGDIHAWESRKDLLIMAGDMHARESKKDGSRKTPLQKAQACEGLTFYEFSYTQAQKHRRAIRRTEHTHPDPDQQTTADGKNSWAGIAQWLTVLVPPILPIKQKKRGRQETMNKKRAKRRQLLEKHTPGWTQEEEKQPEEGPSRRQPKKTAAQANPAGKGKEKTTKKTNRPREPVDEEP